MLYSGASGPFLFWNLEKSMIKIMIIIRKRSIIYSGMNLIECFVKDTCDMRSKSYQSPSD